MKNSKTVCSIDPIRWGAEKSYVQAASAKKELINSYVIISQASIHVAKYQAAIYKNSGPKGICSLIFSLLYRVQLE